MTLIQAVADLSRVVERWPKPDPDVLLQRGAARRGSGDLAGAVEDLTRAIELGRSDVMVLAQRGEARHVLGDLAGAAEDFTRVIELDPRHATAHNNRGFVRQYSGDLDGALDDFLKASELDSNGGPWKNRGIVHALRGQWEDAARCWERALELEPGAHWAAEIGRALEDARDAIAASAWLDREPRSPDEILAAIRTRGRRAVFAERREDELRRAQKELAEAPAGVAAEARARTEVVLAQSLLAAGFASEALDRFRSLEEGGVPLDSEATYAAARAAARLARERIEGTVAYLGADSDGAARLRNAGQSLPEPERARLAAELVTEAATWLERAWKRGLWDPGRPACDPDLATLRSDPRWAAIHRAFLRERASRPR